MGCIFSKKPLSAPAFSDRSSTSARVQHLRNNTSNGILRVPKLNLEQENSDVSEISQGHVADRNDLRLIPPPPPPTSSPIENKPRPQPTKPPTPERERRSMHVQCAEDLRPASPQQSQMTKGKHKRINISADDGRTRSRDTLDDKHKSSVSVSNVALKPNINGIRGAPMPNQDLSLEDLDTELDDYSRIRLSEPTSRINPVITDILLPRRKETSPGETTQQTNNNNIADSKTIKDATPVSVRKDTPYPGKGITVTNKNKVVQKSEEYSTIPEKDDATNINRKDLPSNQTRTVTVTKTKINSNFSKISPSLLKKEILENKDSHLHRDMKNKPGTLSDIHVHTDHDPEIKYGSHPKQVPKTLYEQDLENTRLARKRKRTTNRQSDYTPQQSDVGVFNVKDNDVHLEGSLKSLKGRPDSGTSVWTMDSKKVFGSTDTLRSVNMDPWGETMQDNYPNIKAGMTPVSFRTFDDAADIIDLEDNGDLNNDSWLSDEEPTAKEESFNEWYGVKPYRTVPSAGKKDRGVIKDNDFGPSSSELSTKQKLMYSRFARRPHSESLPRMKKKPPLPPGTQLKARPVSETIRKPNYQSSTFFTTDLDIH